MDSEQNKRPIEVKELIEELKDLNRMWKFVQVENIDSYRLPNYSKVFRDPLSSHPERDASQCFKFIRDNYIITHNSIPMFVDLSTMNEVRITDVEPSDNVWNFVKIHVPEHFTFNAELISNWVGNELSKPHMVDYLHKTVIISIHKPMHLDVIKGLIEDKFPEESYASEYFEKAVDGWKKYAVMLRDHSVDGKMARKQLLAAGLKHAS